MTPGIDGTVPVKKKKKRQAMVIALVEQKLHLQPVKSRKTKIARTHTGRKH